MHPVADLAEMLLAFPAGLAEARDHLRSGGKLSCQESFNEHNGRLEGAPTST